MCFAGTLVALSIYSQGLYHDLSPGAATALVVEIIGANWKEILVELIPRVSRS
jgi:hypothetical protein